MFLFETNRLILRDLREDDIDGMYALDSNPEVYRFLGNQPNFDKKKTEELIQYIRSQYQNFGIGRWAAVEKATGKFVGWSGLKYVTESHSDRINYYDVGYRFLPEFWGKGYATESAIFSIEYGFNVMNLSEIIGTCHEGNLASRRVLEKCGLKFVDQFYWKDIRCDWLKLTQADWKTSKSK